MLTSEGGDWHAQNVSDDLAELVKALEVGESIRAVFSPLSFQREDYFTDKGLLLKEVLVDELEGRGYNVHISQPDSKRPDYIEIKVME